MSVKSEHRDGEIAVSTPPAISEECPEKPRDQSRKSCSRAFASPAVPWVSCRQRMLDRREYAKSFWYRRDARREEAEREAKSPLVFQVRAEKEQDGGGAKGRELSNEDPELSLLLEAESEESESELLPELEQVSRLNTISLSRVTALSFSPAEGPKDKTSRKGLLETREQSNRSNSSSKGARGSRL